MLFNQRFNELMRVHGFRQQFIADQVGVVQQTVSKWQNGKALPDLTTIISLAQLFHVSVDYLLGYSETTDTKKESTVTDDELRAWAIARVQELPEQALIHLYYFLSGLEAGRDIQSALQAADDPDRGSSQ